MGTLLQEKIVICEEKLIITIKLLSCPAVGVRRDGTSELLCRAAVRGEQPHTQQTH